MTMTVPGDGVDHLRSLGEVRALVDAVDQAVYDTVAGTPTPRLDRLLVGVSTAANYSRLWLVTAAVMTVVGGCGVPLLSQACIESVNDTFKGQLDLDPPRRTDPRRGQGLPRRHHRTVAGRARRLRRGVHPSVRWHRQARSP
jgi:hypothetical protein